MNRLDRLDKATANIYFRPDREAVRQELEARFEDFREAPGLEAEAAVEAMGDPDALAEELGRLHRPWWGYLWRVSRVALILAVLLPLWRIHHGFFSKGGTLLETVTNIEGERP